MIGLCFPRCAHVTTRDVVAAAGVITYMALLGSPMNFVSV